CGTALAIEHNGDVYACDHYVYPEFRRGNIRDTPLKDLVLAPEQVQFGLDKRDTLPGYCRECEVRFACQGECPKHRFLKTPQGEWGLTSVGAGYRAYSRHMDPYMRLMTSLLHARRAPAEIMGRVLAQDAAAAAARSPRPKAPVPPGRNDPCPCGS